MFSGSLLCPLRLARGTSSLFVSASPFNSMCSGVIDIRQK
uniref:Uncharacterized protein n=1 Tax=Anguilla anguilla TaxID=7936 RepID=A0A0E9XSP5_ANGAN